MAMAMDFSPELAISSYSTTTRTEYDYGCNWSDWSPVVDWEVLSGGHHDDFHDLIESMMDEDVCNPVKAATSPDTVMIDDEKESNGEDFKGLRLVHLLMAAAEALAGSNNVSSRDLVSVILVRLKELVSHTNGTNMERLAAYFTDALQGLLDGAGSGHVKDLVGTGTQRDDRQMDVIAAFQLLQDMSPCVKFGHFTVNQAILEAVAHDRRVHIVDYDIMEGVQWASLMQALVSKKDGPPTPHLRITALLRSETGRRSSGTVYETGRRLIAFAASIGQPFSFHQCRLDSDETFRASALKLIRGEALIINCMLHLPHFTYRAPDSINSFLSGAKSLNPRLLTLVEEEVGATIEGGFVGRFMDSLHHYSALYDSLEASFPMQSRARGIIEKVFLGPQISGSITRLYRTGEEEGCSWGKWLSAVGYKPVMISYSNHCQAKLLLALFNEGYSAEEVANNRLVLGWKSRNLLSASVWTSL